MKELKEPCKSAIKEERCLGCCQLENPDFTGDKECKYGIRPDVFQNKKKKTI